MTDEEVTVEPSLPGLELPEYHGRPAVGMKTSVSGMGSRSTSPHEIGSRIVFVGEAIVKKAGHEDGEKGLLYVEGWNVKDVFEIRGASGKRLLSTVRSAYRTATDGADPLPYEPGDLVKTDASGVVITPGDSAGMEDDPIVRSLTDETLTPVVIVYSDGARELWPDEFDPGDPRPAIGLIVEDEKGERSTVVEILDGITGETVEKWTAEDEADRLLEAEHAAMLDEAKADRGASEEIFAEAGLESPLEQVDPPEADGDGPGPEGDPFPGYASDGPDDEIEVDEGEDLSPIERLRAEVLAEEEAAAKLADVVPIGDREREETDETDPPSNEDFAFVDREIPNLKELVAELTDRDEVLRYLKAEEQGRGRGLKPRKGALEALTKRAAELFTAEGFEAPPIPAGDGFVPGETEPEWDE